MNVIHRHLFLKSPFILIFLLVNDVCVCVCTHDTAMFTCGVQPSQRPRVPFVSSVRRKSIRRPDTIAGLDQHTGIPEKRKQNTSRSTRRAYYSNPVLYLAVLYETIRRLPSANFVYLMIKAVRTPSVTRRPRKIFYLNFNIYVHVQTTRIVLLNVTEKYWTRMK